MARTNAIAMIKLLLPARTQRLTREVNKAMLKSQLRSIAVIAEPVA